MARLPTLAGPCCLLALLAVTAQAAVPLASLQYGVYAVAVESVEKGGVAAPAPATPCTNPNFPNPCLPVIQADEDSLTIRYGPAEGAVPPPPGATVSIYACYSNVSVFNRPWRANSTRVDVLTDRACRFRIKMNAPAGVPGTAVFSPNAEAPSSTVFIRAYVYSAPQRPYGYVNAPGFYQIQKIHTPNKTVKGAAIGMIIAGPVILALALPLDSYLTKRRKRF